MQYKAVIAVLVAAFIACGQALCEAGNHAAGSSCTPANSDKLARSTNGEKVGPNS